MKTVLALVLLLASCAAVQPAAPPSAQKPVEAGFPEDTTLICYRGWWTIVSPDQKWMGVFNIPCGTQVTRKE